MNIYFSTWTHIFSDLHSDLIWVGAVTMPGLRLRDGQVSDFLDLSISLFQLFLGVFSFPWGIVVSKVLNGMEWSEDLIKVVSIYVPAKKIFLDQELKIIVKLQQSLCPDKIEDIQEAEEERKRRDERKRKTWKWKSKVVIANDDDDDYDDDDDDDEDDEYYDDDDHDDGKVARTGVRLLAALAMISLFIWQVRLLIRGCGNIVQIKQVTK